MWLLFLPSPLLSLSSPFHLPQTHDPAAVLHVYAPQPSFFSPRCSVTTLSPDKIQEQKKLETGPAVRTVPNCVRQLMHPADPGLFIRHLISACHVIHLDSSWSSLSLSRSLPPAFIWFVLICRSQIRFHSLFMASHMYIDFCHQSEEVWSMKFWPSVSKSKSISETPNGWFLRKLITVFIIDWSADCFLD